MAVYRVQPRCPFAVERDGSNLPRSWSVIGATNSAGIDVGSSGCDFWISVSTPPMANMSRRIARSGSFWHECVPFYTFQRGQFSSWMSQAFMKYPGIERKSACHKINIPYFSFVLISTYLLLTKASPASWIRCEVFFVVGYTSLGTGTKDSVPFLAVGIGQLYRSCQTT